ncbi:MFS transporter [Bailinhaonella thermotolerans]|uniref:MFS transporter n=2 Tax=Bailinhaonella thermotolerans TaxID=1070861 RepID=A0A3A4BE50_9ACTN|nr:MFS transporter [Bailinhaonella thermotolerans]
MVEPFIGVYLVSMRGFSLVTAGFVMTLFGAGSLLSQPIAGFLADRIGRKAVLTGGMLATGACLVALSMMDSIVGIGVLMLVLGLVLDAYRPASSALVADLVSPQDRPKAYAFLFWAVNMGFTAAMLIGGWLAAQKDFAWMFWVDAIACSAFGLMVWFAVPETRGEAEKASGSYLDVLRDRVMLGFCLILLAYTFVYLQSFTTMSIAMTRQGLPVEGYGLVMAVNGIVIVVLQPLVAKWLGRFDQSRVLALGMALVGVGFAVKALMTTVVGYGVAVAVWTLGEVLTAGIAAAIVAGLAPAHLRGRYMGLFGLTWSLGGLLAPLLGTQILQHANVPTLWVTCGVLAALGGAGQLLIAPAVRRRALVTAEAAA